MKLYDRHCHSLLSLCGARRSSAGPTATSSALPPQLQLPLTLLTVALSPWPLRPPAIPTNTAPLSHPSSHPSSPLPVYPSAAMLAPPVPQFLVAPAASPVPLASQPTNPSGTTAATPFLSACQLPLLPQAVAARRAHIAFTPWGIPAVAPVASGGGSTASTTPPAPVPAPAAAPSPAPAPASATTPGPAAPASAAEPAPSRGYNLAPAPCRGWQPRCTAGTPSLEPDTQGPRQAHPPLRLGLLPSGRRWRTRSATAGSACAGRAPPWSQ